jgi:beta-barrel assembly-enhancing protease
MTNSRLILFFVFLYTSGISTTTYAFGLGDLGDLGSLENVIDTKSITSQSSDSSQEGFTLESGLEIAETLYDVANSTTGPVDEFFLGREASARLISKYKVIPFDSKISQYVNNIGNTLTLGSNAPYLYSPYTFIVLDSNEINAFAAPGGIIMITTGMLRFVQSEDELAGILGHEIGHVEMSHGAGAVGQEKMINLTTLVAKLAVKEASNGEVPELLQNLIDSALEEVMDLLMNNIRNGYSVDVEAEADQRAIHITNASNYNAGSIINTINRFKKVKGNYGGAGYPDDRAKRSSDVIKTISQNSPLGEKARTERFKKVMAHLQN